MWRILYKLLGVQQTIVMDMNGAVFFALELAIGYEEGTFISKYHMIVKAKGASTVKWPTLDPCSSLCESDPKLYTNFELYEIEIHKHLENI